MFLDIEKYLEQKHVVFSYIGFNGQWNSGIILDGLYELVLGFPDLKQTANQNVVRRDKEIGKSADWSFHDFLSEKGGNATSDGPLRVH
jgi:hypothetical protein